jgi:chemotaxis protein histidine kinase CheA
VTAHLAQFTAPSERNTIEVADGDYTELISLLSRSAQTQALDQLLSWQWEPASRALRRLADQAMALAKRLGKGDIEVDIAPTAVRLDPEVFGPFFSDLGHIARNAVDHGLEPAAGRQAAGKAPNGRLVFSVQARDESLIFEVSDDGSGIDWESVRTKGRELGLPARTPAELLAVLCHQGVSTRSEVTQISGRGVGMSAVKQRIEAMHGTLEVESSRGIGTKWTITFPWAPERATERLLRSVNRRAVP